MNKVIILGRLGNDVEIRTAKSGKSVAKLRVATNSGWGENETTDWHNVVVFDKQAEACARYLSKGREVLVEGRISYRTFDKEDGSTAYFTDILASRVQFVGGGGGKAKGGFGGDAGGDPAPF